MRRRKLLQRIGATGIATTAFAGISTARQPAAVEYGIDREIDVSDVSGQVTLDELLEPAELERLPEDADPSQQVFTIKEEAETTSLDDCCLHCCDEQPKIPRECNCMCCRCIFYNCDIYID